MAGGEVFRGRIAVMTVRPEIRLIGADLQAQNLSGLTLEKHLHGSAANFAINRELLGRLRGVHRKFERLPTIWTLDFFRFLHLPDRQKVVIVPRAEWPVIQLMSTQWHKPCSAFRGSRYERNWEKRRSFDSIE
jgi:hypothetical protein